MTDQIFPTGFSHLTGITTSFTVFADNGTAGGYLLISDILGLIALPTIPAASGQLLGGSGSSGTASPITVGTGLVLSSGTLSATGGGAGALLAANNLSDVASASTARTNLALGTAAVKAASGSGGTVASVSGTITSGHLATFADTSGTVQDGGAVPTTIVPGSLTHRVPTATDTVVVYDSSNNDYYTGPADIACYVPATLATPSDSSGTITCDATAVGGSIVTLTGTGRTVAALTNRGAGRSGVIEFVQGTGGSKTITTWDSSFDFGAAGTPTLSTAAGAKDLLSWWDDGTKVLALFRAGF